MNAFFYKQFEITRGQLLQEVGGISSDIVDVQPEGFNNTIHWHVGHVLTVTEQFLFGFPKASTHLPEEYLQLFGNGTKPADWSGEVPSVEELVLQLKDQLVRMKDISDDFLAQPLAQPFHGLQTHGELASLSLSHESNHLGQLHAIKLVATRTGLHK
ncbi:hypothetical protein A374_07614 [Fictibacillus macauensis ZFHKF-1]|uniref:DinB-like domain-containing protein n=1 Tax=Fictibacillus macauensis ZFHKF-1 TaxID=1196324 RepID=I8J1S2_9BACL|nr:DinB family protein [Fictibacillus macauensis]EIT85686.1 hypothetical protein A374_07614 [Fictibacillus macauensis ZFHKF-1]